MDTQLKICAYSYKDGGEIILRSSCAGEIGDVGCQRRRRWQTWSVAIATIQNERFNLVLTKCNPADCHGAVLYTEAFRASFAFLTFARDSDL